MALKLRSRSPGLIVACVAFLVALGSAVYAANTVFSTDITDREVKSEDIALKAVTAAHMQGANVRRGLIDLPGNYVMNGRCRDFAMEAPGAAKGHVVMISLYDPAPEGMAFSAVRAVANRVFVKACNFTGGTSPVIEALPVRIVTLG